MLQDVFGRITSGQVRRTRFCYLSLALALVFVLAGVLLGALAGVAQRLGLDTSAVAVTQGAGALGLLAFLTVAAATAFGLLNLSAKRARDIGWHPLVGVVMITALPGLGWLLLAIFPPRASTTP